ncbi:MAG: hypothetical protein ACI9LN_002087 [Saprospiraceae bacterium]
MISKLTRPEIYFLAKTAKNEALIKDFHERLDMSILSKQLKLENEYIKYEKEIDKATHRMNSEKFNTLVSNYRRFLLEKIYFPNGFLDV